MAEFSKHTALIDQYLSGEMTSEEKADFEAQLTADPVLKEELVLHQKISAAILKEGDEALKEQLDDIHEDFVSITTETSWLNKGWWLMVVLAGVLIIFTFVMYVEEPDHTVSSKVENVPTVPHQKVILGKDTVEVVKDSAHYFHVVETSSIKENETDKEAGFTVLKKHYEQPQLATYDFEGKELRLYNFSSSLKNLDIRQHENKLYLYHKGRYYEIQLGEIGKPLVGVEDVRDFETLKYATGSGPKVLVKSLVRYEQKDSVELLVEASSTLKTYEAEFFIEEGKLVLPKKVLNNSSANKVCVQKYGSGESFYTLMLNDDVYELLPGKQKLLALDSTKYFKEAQRTIAIRSETVEDNYFNQESH